MALPHGDNMFLRTPNCEMRGVLRSSAGLSCGTSPRAAPAKIVEASRQSGVRVKAQPYQIFQRTLAIVATQLQEAVEDDARAHGVPDQRDRPVPMRPLHQHVRQQPPRL